ncbi:hypothetical protein [Winogradskyella sediminis]|uniref:hypothetical protein n=1 Tax=Winogradskyella sediminis TaxID=1382466 RepID=UPI000E280A84|nr:hypothetical protein [Winogradskyella sediminis]REG89651.1 hypothetical protein C8N41_101893 [Winogradskyella sediminis]
MKISIKKFVILIIVVTPLFFYKSFVIHNPKSSECKIISSKIIELREGPTFDIQFKGDDGKSFYINRGIESGLNLDTLNAKVLNKTVTLHLPKMIYGPSKHIAQLAVEDQIIYSEFKD